MVRDRQSGVRLLLDMVAVNSAKVQVRRCEGEPLVSGAADVVCVAIHKPDTGAGTDYTSGVSFTAKARSSVVGQFYRDWFASRGWHTSVMQDSSGALILEAEDAQGSTKARVVLRGSVDSAAGFLTIA